MSPNWGEVEAALVIPDALVKIAQGGDVEAIAEELDDADRRDPQQVAIGPGRSGSRRVRARALAGTDPRSGSGRIVPP